MQERTSELDVVEVANAVSHVLPVPSAADHAALVPRVDTRAFSARSAERNCAAAPHSHSAAACFYFSSVAESQRPAPVKSEAGLVAYQADVPVPDPFGPSADLSWSGSSESSAIRGPLAANAGAISVSEEQDSHSNDHGPLRHTWAVVDVGSVAQSPFVGPHDHGGGGVDGFAARGPLSSTPGPLDLRCNKWAFCLPFCGFGSIKDINETN